MSTHQILDGQHVPIRVWTDDIDAAVRQQLTNIAMLPFVHSHIAAMADVHLGKGATIGSVIATDRAIIPAAVGVDIGCGMVATRLSLTASDVEEKSLKKVFDQISRDVPVGRAQHRDNRVLASAVQPFRRRLDAIIERHPEVMQRMGKHSRWTHQMGTLGGGNHFIEVCLDESDRVWVMLHSGSRGIGNALAGHFIELAKRDMERHATQLPDRDLAYLAEGSQHFDDYMEAVAWAQDYAYANRQAMLELVLIGLARHLPAFDVTTQAVNCHHNYVAREYQALMYGLHARAPSARGRVISALCPAAWARKAISCAARATPRAFTPAPTAPAAA